MSDPENVIWGTSASETLRGSSINDRIIPLGGNDTIYGNGGDDQLNGYITKVSDGSPFTTVLWSQEWYSKLLAFAVWDSADSLLIYGGDGNDLAVGGQSNDKIFGDAGNDILIGGAGNDEIDGGAGEDKLIGREGSDTLIGGDGNDYIIPGNGNDTIYGNRGDDQINGYLTKTPKGLPLTASLWSQEWHVNSGGLSWSTTDSADPLLIYAGDDNDFASGGQSDDKIYGDAGNDILIGEAGNDEIDGGDGEDRLSGGLGNDQLKGGAGRDFILGGLGDDTLDGGTGYDILHGGDGDDTYIINDLKFDLYDSDGTDAAIVNIDFVKIPSQIETVTYAEGVKELPYWISALLGDQANAYSNFLAPEKVFLFGFPSSTSDYSYDLDNEDLKGWLPFNESQQTATRLVLKYIESIVDVTFIETGNINQISVMAFANNEQENSAGYASYPNNTSMGGSDLYFSIRDDGSLRVPINGSLAADTFIHEIGHALGLKHPFDEPDTDGEIEPGPYLQGIEDNTEWTQMSYEGSVKKIAFSELDIAALQYIYGNNPNIRAGDDTYIYDESKTNLIWDGGGIDTIDASAATGSVTIFLKPGYLGFKGLIKGSDLITSSGQITVNFGTKIENLVGSNFSDILTGNELNNLLIGGKGNDRIDGDDGIDVAVYSVDLKDAALNNFVDYGSSIGGIQLTTAWNVEVANESDTLRNIERLKFNDKYIALDLDGNAGKTVKLLAALLGKEAVTNETYVGAGLKALDDGMSYEALMRAGLDIVLGAAPNGASVVDLLYRNLVGSSAPQSILDEYGSMIDNGLMTSTELGIAVADHSLNATNIDLVGLSQTGVEYIV